MRSKNLVAPENTRDDVLLTWLHQLQSQIVGSPLSGQDGLKSLVGDVTPAKRRVRVNGLLSRAAKCLQQASDEIERSARSRAK